MIVLITYILLGIIQGITEPLPISSSGHIVLLKEFFDIPTPGLTFEIVVHFGSLIAVIIYFQKEIMLLIKESLLFLYHRKKEYLPSFKFSLYLIIATCVTGVLGLILEEFISEGLKKPLYVGGAFLITAGFLWLIRTLQGNKSDEEITLKDAIIIGLAQTLALIPGISRSGTTIVAGMLLGLKRATTLRFSFLLFIPVGLGINIMSYKDIFRIIENQTLAIPYLLAFISAIIVTFYALKWFINIMLRGKLIIFSLYCFILGTITILYQLL